MNEKNMGIPVVITRDSDGNTLHQDIYSRLLKDRNIYISSPGGYCSAGMSIIDTMRIVKCPVYVTAHGSIASMASVITSCGEKGHRTALKGTRVMLHQASSGAQGNIQDMIVSLEETKKVNESLLAILAGNCGKTVDELREKTNRDFWLSADEAKDFGVVDEVL